jgi:hypothetical protein
LASLRELTRGVFPTQLARTGLEPTLRSFLSRAGQGETLQVEPSAAGKRFPARVEAAVYFCSTEAVGAGGPVRSVTLAVVGDVLIHTVSGVTRTALDLRAISDRVAAVGGVVGAEDDVLRLSIPLDEEPDHDLAQPVHDLAQPVRDLVQPVRDLVQPTRVLPADHGPDL